MAVWTTFIISNNYVISRDMRHLDLFSGIGGFALAADWVWGDEHEIVSFVEIDPFCQKVLKKHWPDVPIHGDIKTFEPTKTTINLLTGGFPCQPYSTAGKRRGKNDDRALWPYMLEIIQRIQPTWIIGENVAGIISMDFFKMLSDLENCKFEVQSFIIPACAVNAPHRRDRVWILAHSRGNTNNIKGSILKNKIFLEQKSKNNNSHFWSKSYRAYESLIQKQSNDTNSPIFCRDINGIPNWMDRIKSLGNAIVPQVVVPIMQAIKEIESN